MAEEVQTGGVMSFKYERGHKIKLSEDEKKEIGDAYARADERKKKERINKIAWWITGALILIIIFAILFLGN